MIRGGTLRELYDMNEFQGKVGYHRHEMLSVKETNFVSATINPKIAHDYSRRNEQTHKTVGMVMEFDTTDMPNEHIAPVR